MEAPASLLDLIAHGGSMRAAADNDLVNAQTAHTQASARSADAGAQLAQAQIPVQQQLAEQERLKTQLERQQLADQALTRQAYINTSGHPEEIRQYLFKNGISYPGYQAWELHDLGLRTKRAALSKDEMANEAALHAQAGEILSPIASIVDPAQRQAAYAQALPSLQSKAPDIQWKTADQFKPEDVPLYMGALGHATAVLAQKKTEQDIKTGVSTEFMNTSHGNDFQASADEKNALLPGKVEGQATTNEQNARVLAGTSPTGITAKDAAKETETARHNKQTEFATMREIALKQKQFDATFGSGLDANGKPLTPEEMKATALLDPTAQAIANYQIPGPPAQTRGGQPSPILRKVLAINPNYDGTQFATRNKVQQDFSPSGASGKALTSTETALKHLNTISEAGKALTDTNIPALNRIAQSVGAAVGGDAKTTYDTIVSMVAPEVSKAVIGGVGGEKDREEMAKNFKSSANATQRENAIGGAVKLLSARMDTSLHSYEQEMGKPLKREMTPEAQAVAKKYSGGGTIRARDPQGNLHEAPAGTALPAGWKLEAK